MLKKLTINDVAREAKVSKGTVSRILNNSRLVKTETRNRVLNIIEKLNYEPNYLAQSLSTKRTYTLGLVLEDISNPFFSAIAKGVDDVARKNNFGVLLYSTNYDEIIEKQYILSSFKRRIDGIIITPVKPESKNVKLISSKNVPFILINCWSHKDGISYIVSDNFKGAYIAVDYLVKLGHKRIAYIGGPNIQGCNERFRGYKKAIEDGGISFLKSLVTGPSVSSYDGYVQTKKLLKANKEITAIFAINDFVAIGVMKAIFDMHLKVPDDISIIGYDDIDICSMLRVPLTTVNQLEDQQGTIACEQIIKLIETKDLYNPIKMVIEPRLVIRESCKKIN